MSKQDSLKEKTTKGILWGGFSNGLQQLLNLFFGIWLSRILNVEDYGVIGVLTIFTLIASTLQESGFTQALANKKNPSSKDYNAVFWCSSLIGLTLYLILFFTAPLLAQFFHIPELTPLARILFLGFLFSSFGTAQNAYLFKNLMVKQRAIAMIVGLIFSGSLGIILAYQGFAYWGLAIQHLSYILCTNSLFWFFSKWRPTLQFSFQPIREMLPFSSRILVTKICTHLNNHVFNILIGRFYNRVEVGYFSQANKWNLMGSSVVSEMIQGVAQPVLSNVVKDQERQVRILKKMLAFTAFVSFPALWGLAYIAPEFIAIALTEKWMQSAYILQILCIGGAFMPLSNLLGNLIISRGKSSVYMWNTISFGAVQLALALSLYPYGIRTMVIASVCVQIMWFFIWFLISRQEISLSWKVLFTSILPFLLSIILSLAISHLLTQSIHNIYLLILSKIAITASAYLSLLAFFKNSILLETFEYLKKLLLN